MHGRVDELEEEGGRHRDGEVGEREGMDEAARYRCRGACSRWSTGATQAGEEKNLCFPEEALVA
jgi:hypothetical protein